jgi:nicotinamide-nucleotide amidase
MRAEIISIGDEITSGQLLDTNSQWLSLRLEELGIRVLCHTAVGDELEALVQVFQQAVRRADLVVATGGLGPTADDLTREALARAVGRKLLPDPTALEHIRQLFARRKRPMPEQNESQALMPEGSRVVTNPNGTAPGIDLEAGRPGALPCRVIALPGVPAEMKEMWFQSVASLLRKLGAGGRIIRHRQVRCFGAGESQIEAMLGGLVHKGENPRVGITAGQTIISLRLAASAPTEEACFALIEPVVATIRQRLGKLVFGEDDDDLQDAVVRLLRQRRQTLATAEWGSAGQVADRLGGVAEAAGFFSGGVVVRSAAALGRALDLPADLAARAEPSAQDVVTAMAEACRKRFASDLGLAIGPFPRFDPTTSEPKPVLFALAAAGGTTTKSIPFALHPAILKVYCANHALDMVRLALLEEK